MRHTTQTHTSVHFHTLTHTFPPSLFFLASPLRRKKEAREVHKRATFARRAHGLRAKLYNKKRFAEKAQMKKTIKMHEERDTRKAGADVAEEGAVPAYLLDRQESRRAKVLSNTVKQKRKEKAGKWDVPLPKVRPISEDEMFKVLKTGKRRSTCVFAAVVWRCALLLLCGAFAEVLPLGLAG
jgi:ribosome biogenesis protein NSA2